ncbi:hypothetical protein MOTE_12750 [Moorella thermoacetica]|uniref:Uncharacterized protein n=1 Tax=Neomoorella thermoacetica TaxID=1525 RepID=A0A1J5NLD4_NEOTH|nr:hypothetical protein MOTE_12750 [Moorella thermoacetica]
MKQYGTRQDLGQQTWVAFGLNDLAKRAEGLAARLAPKEAPGVAGKSMRRLERP